MTDLTVDDVRRAVDIAEMAITSALNAAATSISQHGCAFDYEVTRYEVTTFGDRHPQYRYVAKVTAAI